MRKLRFSLLLLIPAFIYAQSGQVKQTYPLYVEIYKLDNGLTVYLNEDHNQPSVFGAVAVRGGAKLDPEGQPGTAHYFEHIMFKGTDMLGTTDYKSEKVFLDSIKLMYDKLGETKDEAERTKIQKKINDLSIKASDYAIPNEVDKVLKAMGGTGLNAYTSKDAIVYHNSFPSDQIEKWLEVYSHRFINPVYRLFQSELETVYEEKNMYADNPMSKMFETFEKNFFGKHPYGNSIIGETENLKNPSLTKMDQYFKSYYIANNMALIISGDFNSEAIKPIIQAKFGKWRSGTLPERKIIVPEPFKGREEVTGRFTPIKIELVGYRGVPNAGSDEIALTVCNYILSNQAQTGLLDQLSLNNKLIAASSSMYQYNEVGGIMLVIVPKVIGQSFSKAEKMVFEQITKLCNGDFDDDLFEAVKIEMKRQFQNSLESNTNRAYSMIAAFTENRNWDEYMLFTKKVDQLTKQDIVNIAKKYYGDNYLVFKSKIGFPKKDKIAKPPYKPIEPKNNEAKSEYAKYIENIPVTPVETRFIEFSPIGTQGNFDVQYMDFNPLVHYFHTKNPVNEIFTLRLEFGIGTEKNPLLEPASQYIDLIGTQTQSMKDFKKNLQKLGSTVSFSCDDSYFSVYISGFENKLAETIKLVNELLTQPKGDASKIKILAENMKLAIKYEDKDVQSVSDALDNYVLYKNKSDYIDRYTVSEIKKLNSDSLLAAIAKALKYELNIHFIGKNPSDYVKNVLLNNLPLTMMVNKKSDSPIELDKQVYNENSIFVVDDKKAVQSQITMYIDGNPIDRENRAYSNVFNKYYGGDMSSIVFQEVREFRSLAYGAYAAYSNSFYFDKKGCLTGWLSTQSDKTVEAIDLMSSLLQKMPQKPERIEAIRSSMIQSINAQRPTFRYASRSVASWMKQGWNEDPRKMYLPVYEKVTFDDINKFYEANIQSRPIVFTIVGEKKRMNLESLSKYGKLIELDKKVLFRK